MEKILSILGGERTDAIEHLTPDVPLEGNVGRCCGYLMLMNARLTIYLLKAALLLLIFLFRAYIYVRESRLSLSGYI
jgi:hypothetical protein